MKNLLFTKICFLSIAIVIISSNILNAQLINGDFSNFCQTGNAFQINNCVENWRNSHGTPTLSNAGNGSAWMWSYNGNGEGIVANFNFDPCNVYEITFRVRADDKDSNDPNVANTATINLEAANGVPQGTGFAFPNVNNTQVIFSDLMGAYLNTGTTVTVTFAPQNLYSELWIYPFMQANSDGVSQAEMLIDDIHIHIVSECCTTCDDYDPTPPSFTYTNILDPCFIEFNNFENAALSCPLTTPGFYVMDYGDGTFDGPNPTAHCDNHVYSCDGIYEACLTYYFYTPTGELCETTYCTPEPIVITGCNDCCEDCDVDNEVTEVTVDGCFATVCSHATFDEPCIKPAYSWMVDGEAVPDPSPKDPTTFSHQFPCDGTYEICGTVTVFNTETNLYCEDTDCVEVTITDCGDCDCEDIEAPINLQVLPNGSLSWDPVSGAAGYIICSPGAGKPILNCNCKYPISIAPITFPAGYAPPFILPLNLQRQCFVWQVKAVCADGTISDASKQHCYPSKKFVLAEAEDADPKIEIGPGKFAQPNENNAVTVYPNPTTDYFKIDLISETDEVLTIQLIDQSGSIVLAQNNQLYKGYNQFNFSLTDIARGVYMLKVSSKQVKQYNKLILTQ